MHLNLLFVTLVTLALAQKPKPIATALTLWAVAVNTSDMKPVKTAMFALIAVIATLATAQINPFPKAVDIALAIAVATMESSWLGYVALAFGIVLHYRK